MTTRQRTLGVAVVGLGVGEQHARAYASSGCCEVRWLLDHDPAKASALAREIGARSVAGDLGEVLADPSTDVVSIASYDDDHAGQVVASLSAGKHVFVEKPLCRSREELAAIRGAWKVSGGRHLVSNLVLRGAPVYEWLAERIAAGEMGRIYAFDGDYLYGRIHKITEGWRKDVEDYSVMQGGGVHLVDLMFWLTGERPAFVTAAGNRIATAGTAFRYEDFMAASYEFPSGLVGRVTANFGCVHRHQHVIRVFGTRATFLYDDRGPRFHLSRSPEDPPVPIERQPLPPSKGVRIPEFVRGILEERDVRAETETDFAVVAACFAADRALREKRRVEIDYP